LELPGAQIQGGAAGGQDGFLGRALGAQADADAGQEFLEAEGFGDVVVGAALEPHGHRTTGEANASRPAPATSQR
jgi:hypothetical protein